MKCGDGADGPARTGLPPADGARPQPASQRKIDEVLEAVGLLREGACRVAGRQSKHLFDNKPEQYTPEHFELFAQLQDRAERGRIRAAEPDAARSHRLARECLGEERHPAGLSHRRRSSTCRSNAGGSRSSINPLTRCSTSPRGRRAHRAGRLEYSRWLLISAGRHLHAADVHQRRRICRRWHHGRFARAGRKLRADRQELPHFRRHRRSAACWSRSARCR